MSWTGDLVREQGPYGPGNTMTPRLNLGSHTFAVKPEPGMIVEVRSRLNLSTSYVVRSLQRPDACVVRPARPGDGRLGPSPRTTWATKD